jgi:phage tail tape-measure protein
MPSKKKTKKKQTKLSTAKKRTKKTQHKKHAKAPKKAIKKQPSKMTSSKASPPRKRETPARRAQGLNSSRNERAASARQSGDLEGLSRVAQADSESVDELVEEGNVFEAGAVAGVEEADDEDTREVHTREILEDDVPDEYLEED